MKVTRALSLTTFVFGLLGWMYIVGIAYIHPETLPQALTHLTPWIREDTFGIVCFAVSFVSFFVWNMSKRD
jgi:amino acid permease